MAAVAALIAGLVSWFVDVRYGTRWAVALPVLALLTSSGTGWRAVAIALPDATGLVAAAVFALPTLVGAGLGIAVAHARRRR